jgi:hypothetical protein
VVAARLLRHRALVDAAVPLHHRALADAARLLRHRAPADAAVLLLHRALVDAAVLLRHRAPADAEGALNLVKAKREPTSPSKKKGGKHRLESRVRTLTRDNASTLSPAA